MPRLVRFMAAAIVVIAALYVYMPSRLPAPPLPDRRAGVASPVPAPAVPTSNPPLEQGPVMTIVLDDFGASMHNVARCMALPREITFAVIPHLADSARVAQSARAAGFDVILHQPMEPVDFPKENPGRYGIYIWQTAAEIRAIFEENLASLGEPLAGVNNHMGSRATQSEEIMRHFFDAFPRHLIFLDSRTAEKSVAYDVARAAGIRAAKNNVFLDNVPDREGMDSHLDMLIRLAQSRGRAIGIGHVHSSILLDVLEARLPRLAESGVRLARLGELAGG